MGLAAQEVGQIGNARGFRAQKLGGKVLDRRLVQRGEIQTVGVLVLEVGVAGSAGPVINDRVVVIRRILLICQGRMGGMFRCQFIRIIRVRKVGYDILHQCSHVADIADPRRECCRLAFCVTVRTGSYHVVAEQRVVSKISVAGIGVRAAVPEHDAGIAIQEQVVFNKAARADLGIITCAPHDDVVA